MHICTAWQHTAGRGALQPRGIPREAKMRLLGTHPALLEANRESIFPAEPLVCVHPVLEHGKVQLAPCLGPKAPLPAR